MLFDGFSILGGFKTFKIMNVITNKSNKGDTLVNKFLKTDIPIVKEII
jgi:hypothetical protein